MQSEIVKLAAEIQTIKYILYVLIALLITLLFGIATVLGVAVKNSKMYLRRSEADSFSNEASHLLEQQQHVELKELCSKRLMDAEGDAWGYYYLAQAHYRLDELVEAKRNFTLAKSMEPALAMTIEDILCELERALERRKPASV